MGWGFNTTHMLIHTNMSVTDVGRHVLPPTVHNEGHSPFCSGSPTVNTILSQCPPHPIVPCHISFLIQSGAKCGTECVEEGEESETRRMKQSRSAGQLGDQRGAALVTSPSTRPVYWLLLVRTRALTVPGHLRSSTGWVEGGRKGGRGGTAGLCTSLAARQSAL